MLRLVNIKIENLYIEADYIPEKSQKLGHVRLYNNGDEEMTAAPDYGPSYPRMALAGLERLKSEIDSNLISEIPKTRTVMWY